MALLLFVKAQSRRRTRPPCGRAWLVDRPRRLERQVGPLLHLHLRLDLHQRWPPLLVRRPQRDGPCVKAQRPPRPRARRLIVASRHWDAASWAHLQVQPRHVAHLHVHWRRPSAVLLHQHPRLRRRSDPLYAALRRRPRGLKRRTRHWSRTVSCRPLATNWNALRLCYGVDLASRCGTQRLAVRRHRTQRRLVCFVLWSNVRHNKTICRRATRRILPRLSL